MSEEPQHKPNQKYNLERRVSALRERHERQRLNLDTLLAAYNLLGDEIKRTEEELARAG